MAGINKVTLIGHLGKDPEVRFLEGGTAVANFSLATSESYKDKAGNKVDQTEWHKIVVWRGLAEFSEKYLKKGMQIYVEGKLRTSSWDDKEGHKREKTEIVADKITLLGRKDDNRGTNDASNDHSSELSASNATDDLPF